MYHSRITNVMYININIVLYNLHYILARVLKYAFAFVQVVQCNSTIFKLLSVNEENEYSFYNNVLNTHFIYFSIYITLRKLNLDLLMGYSKFLNLETIYLIISVGIIVI